MSSTITLASRSRSSRMSVATPVVCIVDDDISVRESPELLIAHAGWQSDAQWP